MRNALVAFLSFFLAIAAGYSFFLSGQTIEMKKLLKERQVEVTRLNDQIRRLNQRLVRAERQAQRCAKPPADAEPGK